MGERLHACDLAAPGQGPRLDAEAFLARVWRMDAALVEAGFPATSPWWRAEIERFVRALPTGRRRWVIRAGRRAGKSTTLARLAVAWAWFGTWYVAPGDVAVCAFVSVSRDEAAGRLRTIGAVLRALGLPFEQRGDEIELHGARPALFRTYACATQSVVGFTAICIFADEVARWESRDSMANPAAEVIGSLMPTLATQAHGFAAMCSSPWSTDDYHAEAFDQGDTEQQVVSFAPTWIANPTITEARTHELEPDPRAWSREYGAEPGVTLSAALDVADVIACFGRPLPTNLSRRFVAIDASSLRGDAFTFIAGGATAGGVVVVAEIGGWEGDALRRVSMADVVQTIAACAKRWECTTVFADQREEASLRALFLEHDLGFTSYAWTEPSKDAAMQAMRRLMRERRVCLPEHATLRRELTSMKARLMPSGRVSYQTNGLDYASALITLAHAIVAGDFLRGSQTDLAVYGLPTERYVERGPRVGSSSRQFIDMDGARKIWVGR